MKKKVKKDAFFQNCCIFIDDIKAVVEVLHLIFSSKLQFEIGCWNR